MRRFYPVQLAVAVLSPENPFEPRREGVSLLLTLDARSLGQLSQEDRERAEFLCELCLTPAVDGLWTWDAEPLVAGLPRTELRPLVRDDRAIGLVGEPRGFIGGVAMWSSHERVADDYGFHGTDREWFIYYSATTKFHTNAKRHFFVTADQRLLSEVRNGPRQQYWRRGRVISVGGALRLAGEVMQAQERIYDAAAAPGYTHRVSVYTLYSYLAPELAPSRIRLHRWLEGRTIDTRPELEALEQSMHDRVVDLLKARDVIALQNARHQNNATVDEILYHLRAAIGSAAALLDSIAVFAQLALRIEDGEIGGPTRLSLRERDFRKLLTDRGAGRLADAARGLGPLFKFLWSLRTPIVHREGLSGTTYLQIDGPGASESRVGLTEAQGAALHALRGHRGESADQWGESDFAGRVHVEPQAFSDRLCLASIQAAERLNSTLADDLGAPAHAFARDNGELKRIRRYRWLVGLPHEGFFSS
jgi:hypothetical protein